MVSLDGVVREPKIRGGRAVLRNTSIEVARVILYINSGFSDKDILERFPQLNKEHLDKAKAYYSQHKEEINAELYLITHPEEDLRKMGYEIIKEKTGIKRVVKK